MIADSAARIAPLPSILAGYDLGTVVETVPLHGGMFTRPIKLVTSTGQYVIREIRFRGTAEQFRFQVEVMNGAADRGVRCPRILSDRHGRWCHKTEHSLFAVSEYLEGSQLDWSDWCRRIDQEPGFAEQIGTQVAGLHNVLADLTPLGAEHLAIERPPIQFQFLAGIRDHWNCRLDELAKNDGVAARRSRRQLLKYRDALDDHWSWLATQVAVCGLADLPRQIVHGDISPVNLVWSGNEWGFIDWDCCHVNHRLYDALGDVMIRPPVGDAHYHELRTIPVRRYLDAYLAQCRRPMSERELDGIPAFCVARQLEDLRQRLDVLPSLPRESDADYARLIEIRLHLMKQIRQTDPGDWCR